MDLNVVDTVDGPVRVQTVLISVADKQGLDQLGPALVEINPELRIYSTGGTYAALESILGDRAATNLTRVSDYTEQPEMQGGLVKTLDFKIYLGLLSETTNAAHQADLQRVAAAPIDMVVSNLYPFSSTVSSPDVTPEKARGNIDIGGPCMVRAAAKNFLRVASVTDPEDYGAIVEELRSSGGYLSLETRFSLARKAFRHTAEYDTTIAGYLGGLDRQSVAACYSVRRGEA